MKTLSDTVLCCSSHSHGCPDATGVTLQGIGSVYATRMLFPVCELLLCRTYTPKQIAEDIEAMKRRHLEVVQELEENLKITARENQVRRHICVLACVNPNTEQ